MLHFITCTQTAVEPTSQHVGARAAAAALHPQPALAHTPARLAAAAAAAARILIRRVVSAALKQSRPVPILWLLLERRKILQVKDFLIPKSTNHSARSAMPPTRRATAAAKAAAASDDTPAPHAAAAAEAEKKAATAVAAIDQGQSGSSNSGSDSDDSDWANIDTSKLAIQRVEPIRGKPKGGHVWKDQKLARFSSLFSKGGDNRLERKNEIRLQFNSMKQLEKDLKAETAEEKQEMKRKREQREKQKKDNELKSQIGTLVQVSTVKMRKYSKKALRGVVKVDLDELKKKKGK